MTRLNNDPSQFADEAIDGFMAAHRESVGRVAGGVVRAVGSAAGQVAVVIGGGSGHYPAFAGLVGPGLAAGAALGNVFASPSTNKALLRRTGRARPHAEKSLGTPDAGAVSLSLVVAAVATLWRSHMAAS